MELSGLRNLITTNQSGNSAERSLGITPVSTKKDKTAKQIPSSTETASAKTKTNSSEKKSKEKKLKEKRKEEAPKKRASKPDNADSRQTADKAGEEVEEYVVEKILDTREINGKKQFLVKWEGYGFPCTKA